MKRVSAERNDREPDPTRADDAPDANRRDESQLLLAARDLAVGYAGEAILPALCFDVRAGECWVVVGPNGAGKTTLLRTLLGLLAPVSGAASASGALGYVPQRSAVLERAAGNARDVVRSGCERGWSFAQWRGEEPRAVADALGRTGCSAFAGQRYSELSEGQRQRVLVARALAGGAALLVLDEPTSAMDPDSASETAVLLRTLSEEHGLGIIVVTHDLGFADRVASHVIVVDRAQGSAVAGFRERVVGLPQVASRYASAFAASRPGLSDA